MSLGIMGALDPGGEGNLSIHYSVAATYSVQAGWLNKITAHCKRCGVELVKGDGTRVVIAGTDGPGASVAYFCPTCVAWVLASVEVVMDRRARDATGVTPQLGQIKEPTEGDRVEVARLAKKRGIVL